MDKKHSSKWPDFKTYLDLTQEELSEIDFKVDLLGKPIEIKKRKGLTQAVLAKYVA